MSSNVFFSADIHAGHSRIIQYCNRPFQNHQEMEEVMIANWNDRLRPGDRLYILGDIAWSTYDWNQFFGRINCRNCHIIWGNHDHPKDDLKKYPWIRSSADIRSIKLDSDKVVLCHYAMRSWPGRNHGSFHLFGHSHSKLAGEGRSMDVGVDTRSDYSPWEWSEIRELLKDKPIYVYGKLPEGGEI